MHGALLQAEAALGVHLEYLRSAADISATQTAEAQSFFKTRLGLGDPLDIVVCGSMARQEMSRASDFDYLIVAHGLAEDATKFRAFRAACDEWCTQRSIKPPGATGIFGKVVSASEMIEQIGLEFDTNTSLTRRILLIEEGVSVLDPDLHRRFVRIAIARYLDGENFDEHGVPRFLLNDVCRYWRTIAVDYQAKVWQRIDTSGWGLRYLKLRVSRKVTFAGSLVPLLLVALRSPKSTSDLRDFLTAQYVDLPPLARLAQLTTELASDSTALDHLGHVLGLSNVFAEQIAQVEHREALEALETPHHARNDDLFWTLRDISVELQQHLEGLFFDSEGLGPLGRKYLSF